MHLSLKLLRVLMTGKELNTYFLQVIIPNLLRLAKDDKIACVTSNTVPDMLSNIRDIHRLHIRFSSALRDVMDPYPYHTNCVGNIFLNHVSVAMETGFCGC